MPKWYFSTQVWDSVGLEIEIKMYQASLLLQHLQHSVMR